MKKLSLSWSALSLIAPALIVAFLLVGSVFHSYRRVGLASSTPTAGPTSGNVQVGFVTTITGQPPSGIQNVFLNVVAVRINTKPKPGAKNQGIPSENDANWRSIPVPAGVGSGISGKPGDLQIDMIAGQGKYQTFNTAKVRPNRYSSVEVLLDTAVPGTIVPVCSSGGGAVEGCMAFPMVLQNPGNQLSFVAPSQIVVAKNSLTQLPLQLKLEIVGKPTSPGAPYTVNVTTAPAPGNASQFLASVGGAVGPAPGNSTVKNTIRHLQVAAENAGTSTIVATSDVDDNGNYTMFLPASVDKGTLYDFFVSGGAATFEAARGINQNSPGGLVFPGQSYTLNFGSADGGQTVGSIGGQLTDSCTGKPLPGATLEILMPPDGSSANCTTSPSDCVSVAYATTDNGGRYPMPGTFQSPAYFNNVAVLPTDYTVLASAPGYDSQIFQAQATNGTSGTHGGVCTGSSGTACDFALTTSYITGNISLTGAPPSSNSVNVQVLAEESGTNNLISALPMPLLFRTGTQNLAYTINVPSKIPTFDLFATTADLFEGVTDPYPGHTIITQSKVAGAPTACATTASADFTEPMDCTGHGSIVGTAVNSDSATTVELIKNKVQIMQVPVGPATPAPSVGNTYSFCAPPDTAYTLQRLEENSPVGTPAAVASMPVPAPTSSPCPSNCFTVDLSTSTSTKTCPGLCGTAIQPPL